MPRRLPDALRRAAGATPRGLPGLRPGLQSVLGRVFAPDGRPGVQPAAGLGDPGLLGPASASWRLVAEPAAIAGGIRALLLQTLHPAAMAGVAAHSRFREDPLGRLARTSGYVTTSAFGTTTAAFAAARRVRAVHRTVRGTAPDGRRYAADDPRLLAWVSVAFTCSLVEADRLWAPEPADVGTVDRFVEEQARIAALLDPRVDLDALARDADAVAALRAGRVGADTLPLLADLPRDLSDLRAVLRDFEPDLAMTAAAREALHFLVRPPIPATVRAGYLALLAGAAASLSRAHRAALGVPTDPVTTAAAVATTGATLAAMRLAAGVSPALAAATARARGRSTAG